ncbi:hypothetical protein ACQPYK_37190 [Streptosporangium sp. CA-135522]|uniref:hypothetical protein n=1 Tax=Streptosporangium sp. CA-135522 TaxID=3240072 RepID=UPI003D912584
MPEYEKAMRPEDITRLFVERSTAGDAAGVAALYEEDAVTPPGDGAGTRAQVVRRQPDGSRLRLLDQPEFVSPTR